jgi:hypothetical protein
VSWQQDHPPREGHYGYGYQPGGHMEAHRGGMLLAFGLLGFLVCFIFGIFAWLMGNEDLSKIQSGTMDPEGLQLTQAGRILGIVSTIIGGLTILFVLFVFMLALLGA